MKKHSFRHLRWPRTVWRGVLSKHTGVILVTILVIIFPEQVVGND